jgi:hypothetical protein
VHVEDELNYDQLKDIKLMKNQLQVTLPMLARA